MNHPTQHCNSHPRAYEPTSFRTAGKRSTTERLRWSVTISQLSFYCTCDFYSLSERCSFKCGP